MRKHPKYAQAYVRFYLARCWMWVDDGELDAPVMVGVHWWDDWLLKFCVWFHNWFIAPFQAHTQHVGFPVEFIEVYDMAILEELEQGGHLGD